jgi:hypothetical protein
VSGIYTSGQTSISPVVQRAIDEVGRTFDGHLTISAADGSGGAFVVIEGVILSDRFEQGATWIGFQISYLYPAADVYPHYVRVDLSMRDGCPLGAGFSPTTWGYDNRPAVQVSRRSNRWDPRVDTAALKAVKVLAWINGGK